MAYAKTFFPNLVYKRFKSVSEGKTINLIEIESYLEILNCNSVWRKHERGSCLEAPEDERMYTEMKSQRFEPEKKERSRQDER